MAVTLRFFLFPDDERALFCVLARHNLTIHPKTAPIR